MKLIRVLKKIISKNKKKHTKSFEMSELINSIKVPSCVMDIILEHLRGLQMCDRKNKLFKKYKNWNGVLGSYEKLDDEFLCFFKGEFDEKHMELMCRNERIGIPINVIEYLYL